jgi:O-antigen ligase
LFALPGICGLIFFILARPQEFYEPLQRLPLLYLFCAMAVGGYVLDLKLRRLEPIAAPTLPWVVAFLLWALVCTAVKAPDQVMGHIVELAILMTLYGTIAHGIQRFRTFQMVTATMMATCLFLAFVCWDQGRQDRSCVATDPEHPGEGTPDGRPCEIAEHCLGPDAEPGEDYRCEKVGMFGTYSIEDRVRYRGELHDPNELGMTICIGGLSFLIAFGMRRRTPGFTILVALGSILIFWTILMTQSRGALVVFMAVPGVWFVRRYGVWGMAMGAVAALPVILLNARSGEKADMSTMLRYEAWAAGFEMFKASPVFGVGQRLFGENHFMAAHNSYVVAMSELGAPGLFLFFGLLYMSVKILWTGVRELAGVPGAEVARVWGVAMLASYAGMLFQITTLSFTYHTVLWIMLGLAGAYSSAVRFHRPAFQVRFTMRDFLILVVMTFGFALFLLPIFLKWKQAL